MLKMLEEKMYNTPKTMLKVIEKEIPGIPEAIRSYGQERTPYSMLSRGKTIIINFLLKKGLLESLGALFPVLKRYGEESIKMIDFEKARELILSPYNMPAVEESLCLLVKEKGFQ